MNVSKKNARNAGKRLLTFPCVKITNGSQDMKRNIFSIIILMACRLNPIIFLSENFAISAIEGRNMNKLINFLVRRKFNEMSLKGTDGKNKETVDKLWQFSGDLAEYFSEKDSAEWSYNQEHLYFRLLRGIRDEIFS
mgnify:CR=1 FL=1